VAVIDKLVSRSKGMTNIVSEMVFIF
jgi:hypothetical protein